MEENEAPLLDGKDAHTSSKSDHNTLEENNNHTTKLSKTTEELHKSIIIEIEDKSFSVEDHCGPFQVLHVFLTQSTRFSAAFGLFLMSFGIYNPGWHCLDNYSSNYSSYRLSYHNYSSNYSSYRLFYRNYSSNYSSYHPSYHNYSTHRVLVNNSKNDLGENIFSMDNFSSTSEYVCFAFERCKSVEFHPEASTIVTEFSLICDRAHIPSLLISVQMAGILLGSLVAGQIGETCGRKSGVYSSTAVLMVCSGLSVLSISWEMYMVFIFGVGYGCGGILATFMIISTEFLNPKWRGLMAAVPVPSIALAAFACVILVSKDWRVLHLVTSGLSALALLGGLWVPESLLWLRIHGTPKQSAKVIRKISILNKASFKNKDGMYDNEESKNITTKSYQVKKKTIYSLFSTHSVRLLTIKTLVIYLFVIMSYYTIGFGVQALPGDFYTNFFISVITEGPFSLVIGLVCNIIGRKYACSIFASVSSALCLAITIVSYTATHAVCSMVTRIFAILARATVFCIVQCFNIFMIELFPTSLRCVAFGFNSSFSRLGLIFAPVLIPTREESLPISFSCLAGILFLSVLVLLTLPETRNKSLTVSVDEESSSCSGSSASQDSS